MHKSIKPIALFLLFFWLKDSGLKCQVLQDAEAFERIRTGVEKIYNCNFAGAKSDYRFIKAKYPNHSVPYLFKGIIIYWENYPLIPGTTESKLFIENLEKCFYFSQKSLEKNENDAENTLAGLGALGMLLLYYADNGLTRSVISLAPSTYQYVMKSFDYTHVYSDFYFITGLYNYYREAYPEARPIYKPVVFFFPRGNKLLGLQQLKIAADSAIFLKAESFSFLSGIYQSFEKNPGAAIEFSKKLVINHQENVKFQTDYLKDLLLDKKYNTAEKILDSLPYPVYNKYLQARIDIFRAVLYEKKHKNDKKAEKLYFSGIKKAEEYRSYAADYQSYAYFGLSRIYDRKGDKKSMKKYRKLAENMSTFAHINFDD